MKRIALIIAASATIFAACNKDYDDVSTLQTLPYVELNGDKYITINVGDPMPADPGASVVNDVPAGGGGNNFTATDNNVDVNTPGLYYMLYETATANGFTASAARYVAVTDFQEPDDVSGDYVRAATGAVVQVDRVSRALYRVTDMGGANIPNDAIHFVRLDDTTIELGPQWSESLGTEISGVNGYIDYGPPMVISYALRSPGYGTQQRFFEKISDKQAKGK